MSYQALYSFAYIAQVCSIQSPWFYREALMKISARNRLKGRILEVKKGATTAHVRLDIGGAVVTASITNEAVDELGLAAGGEAYAVVKASDVMIAIDG